MFVLFRLCVSIFTCNFVNFYLFFQLNRTTLNEFKLWRFVVLFLTVAATAVHSNRLPHFTPCHTLESSGINVFAQQLPVRGNLYAFPPFVLISPLLRFFIDKNYQHPFTIIVPDIQPRRYWCALLQATSIDRFLLGRKGDDSVLFFPSAATPGWFPRPLQWDLWAFRCVC